MWTHTHRHTHTWYAFFIRAVSGFFFSPTSVSLMWPVCSSVVCLFMYFFHCGDYMWMHNFFYLLFLHDSSRCVKMDFFFLFSFSFIFRKAVWQHWMLCNKVREQKRRAAIERANVWSFDIFVVFMNFERIQFVMFMPTSTGLSVPLQWIIQNVQSIRKEKEYAIPMVVI